MLVRSKSSYQKIIMGLLSYSNELNATTEILEEMEWYRKEDNRRIYLYREDDSDDFIGLIGIEIDDDIVIVRRLTLTPSYHNEGHGGQMLKEIEEMFEDKKVTHTFSVSELVSSWDNPEA